MHAYKFEVINFPKESSRPIGSRECEKYSNKENFKQYFKYPTLEIS